MPKKIHQVKTEFNQIIRLRTQVAYAIARQDIPGNYSGQIKVSRVKEIIELDRALREDAKVVLTLEDGAKIAVSDVAVTDGKFRYANEPEPRKVRLCHVELPASVRWVSFADYTYRVFTGYVTAGNTFVYYNHTDGKIHNIKNHFDSETEAQGQVRMQKAAEIAILKRRLKELEGA